MITHANIVETIENLGVMRKSNGYWIARLGARGNVLFDIDVQIPEVNHLLLFSMVPNNNLKPYFFEIISEFEPSTSQSQVNVTAEIYAKWKAKHIDYIRSLSVIEKKRDFTNSINIYWKKFKHMLSASKFEEAKMGFSEILKLDTDGLYKEITYQVIQNIIGSVKERINQSIANESFEEADLLYGLISTFYPNEDYQSIVHSKKDEIRLR